MCHVHPVRLQLKPKSAEAPPSSLAEAVKRQQKEQQEKKQQEKYKDGKKQQKQQESAGRTVQPQLSTAATGQQQTTPWPYSHLPWLWPSKQPVPQHQQAYQALKAAEADLKAAKKAVKAAAAAAAAASTADEVAKAKDIKEVAKVQQEEAELQVELTKVWVLCVNDGVRVPGKSRNFFDLPQESMKTFKPFGM